VRAARNCAAGVDADGNPVRYQWGAYDGMQNEWAIDNRQSGWYRRSLKAFVPSKGGTLAFFIVPNNVYTNLERGIKVCK